MLKSKYFMSILFTITSFMYLFVGTLFITMEIMFKFPSDHFNPVFMLMFYGFVVMMIFGISYIFIPGIVKSTINVRLAKIEYIIYNAGIISLFTSIELVYTGLRSAVLASSIIIGILLILISVAIHAYNLMFLHHAKYE